LERTMLKELGKLALLLRYKECSLFYELNKENPTTVYLKHSTLPKLKNYSIMCEVCSMSYG